MSGGPIEREYALLAQGIGPGSALHPYLTWLRAHVLPLFVHKDSAALFYQRRHQRGVRFIYVAAVLAVAVVVIQSLFLPDMPSLIWIEVALILAMIAVHRLDHRGQWLERWMENRFLAEKLRYAPFTLLLEGCVTGQRAAHSRSFLAPGELDEAWRATCAEMEAASRPGIDTASALPEIRRFVAEKWLQPQRRYHGACAARYALKYERFERIGLAMLVITVGAAVLHALGVGHHTPIADPGAWLGGQDGHGPQGHAPTHLTFGNLLTLLAVVLPAASASLNAVKHVFELKKMALRSARMVQNIDDYARVIAEADGPTELGALVQELEQLFVSEHEEWHALLSFKRADVG